MILKDKTAIITGATRGIGRAIAIRFAKEGCNVAFCGRERGEKMIAVEKELNDIYAELHTENSELNLKAKGYAADVADYDSAQALVKEVLADFGKVDILVNNAGITDDAAVKRMTEEQFNKVLHTNLGSVFCMTKAIQPSMWRQGHGESPATTTRPTMPPRKPASLASARVAPRSLPHATYASTWYAPVS